MDKVKALNKVLKKDKRYKNIYKSLNELGFNVKEVEKNIGIIPNPEVWLRLEFVGESND